VGAFCDDTAGDMAGAAYIFNYSAGSWSKQAKLIGSDTEFWDWFGYSVDIDGNYAVIGVVYDIVKGSEEDGSAYIFYRSGTTWTQQKKLTVQGPYDRIRFGHAVSIDGDYVAVLEEFFSTAYVYNRSGTSWNLQGTLTLQDPVWENTSLASDVFIDNEFVLMVRDVGEFPVQSGGYMFKRSGTSWSRYSKLAPVGGAVLGRCAISAATQTAFLTPNYGGYVYEFDISRGSSDIQVSATVDTATEGGSAGEFTISRHGDTASAVTVYYSISGTATPSSDYTALSGAVNMPAGSSSAKIAVTPIDDTVREVSETVVLSLNASSGYVLGYPSIATVTIKDNEPRPVITIAATTPNVPEAGPSQGVFTFSRTAVDIQLPLTVFYTVAGAAGNGVDYSPLTGTVTFSANNASVTVLVNPIADNRMETDETVLVTIDPNELYYTVGANSSATVTILDDDMPASYDVITHDGFEDGWGNFAYSGWAYMRCEDGYSYPSSGSCAAYLEFDSPAGDESMIYYSQPKNVSSYTHLRIQFDCIGIDLLSGDTWLVQYYDGSTWRIIDELRYGVNFDNYIYYFKQYDLYKGQYNFPTNAKIRFMCNGADGWRYVYLDEILVLGE